ncbi:MAG: hypothetical protein HOP22_13150 [Nitrospiraceae bacterium]|nr:hypothetical protein [Nitrospiraceae bacterium]
MLEVVADELSDDEVEGFAVPSVNSVAACAILVSNNAKIADRIICCVLGLGMPVKMPIGTIHVTQLLKFCE